MLQDTSTSTVLVGLKCREDHIYHASKISKRCVRFNSCFFILMSPGQLRTAESHAHAHARTSFPVILYASSPPPPSSLSSSRAPVRRWRSGSRDDALAWVSPRTSPLCRPRSKHPVAERGEEVVVVVAVAVECPARGLLRSTMAPGDSRVPLATSATGEGITPRTPRSLPTRRMTRHLIIRSVLPFYPQHR